MIGKRFKKENAKHDYCFIRLCYPFITCKNALASKYLNSSREALEGVLRESKAIMDNLGLELKQKKQELQDKTHLLNELNDKNSDMEGTVR